jgi:predicted TIM-barrel fold metal-dependent hydrolase
VNAGFRLMALFPSSQGWTMGSLPVRHTLEQIAAAKLPVMIEAGKDGDASAIIAAADGLTMPLILMAVSPPTLAEVISVLQARPDTYVSTRLLCGGDTIQYLAKAVGAERLIFSSGSPVSCFSSAYLTAKFADITDDERAAILGGNLDRLLGS